MTRREGRKRKVLRGNNITPDRRKNQWGTKGWEKIRLQGEKLGHRNK